MVRGMHSENQSGQPRGGLRGIDTYIELYGEWAKRHDLLARRRRLLIMEDMMLQDSLKILSPILDHEEIKEELIRCYYKEYETIIDTIKDLVHIIEELREKLDIDPHGKPRPSARAHSEWLRFKHIFEKEETKELFEAIGKHNGILRKCFEGRREISSDLNTTHSLGQNQHFNKRVYLSFPDRDCCSQTPQHWYTAKIRLEPKQSTGVVEMVEAMDNLDITTTSLAAAISPNKTPRKARFDISLRRFSRSPKPVPTQTTKQPAAAATPSRQQIRSICSYPAAKLLGGYLVNSDPDNQSMVILERKQPVTTPTCVVSWRSFLTGSPSIPGVSRSAFRRKKMSKKDRLGIASAAAWAALLLCGTPWLEETKMMENDIVLLTEEDLATGNTSQGLYNANAVPAFSYRFSKPDAETCPPQNAESVTGNAIPHRTLFALAVLLIEIGLDTDFQNLYEQEDFAGSKATPAAARATFRGFEDRATLLDSFSVAEEAAEDLYDEMGDAYAEAVKRCLKFNFPGRKSLQRFENEVLRQHFFTGVVAPVHERYEQEQTRHRVFRSV
ncbi:hypothetical protein PG988_007861 [Apiospora saccharicola]